MNAKSSPRLVFFGVWISFVLFSFGVILNGVTCMNKKSNKAQSDFRYLQLLHVPLQNIDPAKIRTASQYELVSAIYSPLIEYDNNGKLIASLAERFYWEGNHLVFELPSQLFSTKGDKIDAEDVVMSMKRLFLLSSNSHGDIKELLCHGKVLKNLEDDCPGLIAEKNTVRLVFDAKRHYLIPMLTNIDFAIIPKKAIDPQSLKIIDHSNGTGPYILVSNDDAKEEITLQARVDHRFYKPTIPQKVKMKVIRNSDGSLLSDRGQVDLLRAGVVDFIPTITFPNLDYSFQTVAKDSKFHLLKTQNIALNLMIFTSKGKSRFSSEQRLKVGKIIRDKMSQYYRDNLYGRLPTMDYFPRSGAGFLRVGDRSELEKKLNSLALIPLEEKMKVSIGSPMFDTMNQILGENVEFDLVPVNKNPIFVDFEYDDQPDAHITTTDIAFNEDFNLLAYTRILGGFPYDDETNQKWLDDYMKEESTKKRLLMMQDLHRDMLFKANLVPLSSVPYIALSTSNWKMNFSDLFAGSPLWQIEHRE